VARAVTGSIGQAALGIEVSEVRKQAARTNAEIFA
jgi:hypothetical protein